jgi:hypothetical protein
MQAGGAEEFRIMCNGRSTGGPAAYSEISMDESVSPDKIVPLYKKMGSDSTSSLAKLVLWYSSHVSTLRY